jgi:hypothetical protein
MTEEERAKGVTERRRLDREADLSDAEKKDRACPQGGDAQGTRYLAPAGAYLDGGVFVCGQDDPHISKRACAIEGRGDGRVPILTRHTFCREQKGGVTEAQLLALPTFERSGAFSASEKLGLRVAVALTKTSADVGDELFAALQREFSEPQLVELAAAIGWENSRARFNRTFAIEAAGFSHGGFCVMPERGERPD